MLKRTLLLSLFLLLACLTPVAAADAPGAGLSEVSAAQIWQSKAGWVGQKAVILPAKIYQNVSFLFLYQDPTAPASGADQYLLGKSLFGKPFVIRGLYELNKDSAKQYYWYLATDKGDFSVWVKDNKDRALADQPFVLDTEIAEDRRAMEPLAALPGLTLWYNINSGISFSKGGSSEHLAPLTIREFHSDGPFSEKYQLLLTKEDGSVLDWTVGLATTPPVYDHRQFYALLQKSFYLKSPYETHPGWPEARWAAIKARKVALGMDQEMVNLSWGAATQVTKAKDGTETWEYPDSRYLFLKDKKLIKIKVPKPPAAEGGKTPQDKDKDKDKNKDKEKLLLDLIEVPEAGPVEKPAPANAPAEKDKNKDKEEKR
jgi:hypothetical protein